MIFSQAVLTPANTQKIAPLISHMKCSSGVIYQVDIYFPPGPSGLTGLQVRSQNVTLYPRDGSTWFIGDNIQYTFPDLYELHVDSNRLDIYTYNIDVEYSHTVILTIGVVSKPEFISHFLPGRSLEGLNNTLDQLQTTLTSDQQRVNLQVLEYVRTKESENGGA